MAQGVLCQLAQVVVYILGRRSLYIKQLGIQLYIQLEGGGQWPRGCYAGQHRQQPVYQVACTLYGQVYSYVYGQGAGGSSPGGIVLASVGIAYIQASLYTIQAQLVYCVARYVVIYIARVAQSRRQWPRGCYTSQYRQWSIYQVACMLYGQVYSYIYSQGAGGSSLGVLYQLA